MTRRRRELRRLHGSAARARIGSRHGRPRNRLGLLNRAFQGLFAHTQGEVEVAHGRSRLRQVERTLGWSAGHGASKYMPPQPTGKPLWGREVPGCGRAAVGSPLVHVPCADRCFPAGPALLCAAHWFGSTPIARETAMAKAYWVT